MNILLTSDDGLETEGLKSLYWALKKIGNVTVISPYTEQSAVSHAITIFNPLFITKNTTYLGGKNQLFLLRGTPADCVKVALSRLLKKKPAIVVSGINSGANVGADIFYSGTVAAAMEGALWGITSFAVSLEKKPKAGLNFAYTAKSAVKIISSLLGAPKGALFNINVPAIKSEKIKGALYTRQQHTVLADNFVKGVDPRGRDYYWVKAIPHINQPAFKDKIEGISDIESLKKGYISITPLKPDLTNYNMLEYLSLPK
jgi:5'-nucleotidase